MIQATLATDACIGAWLSPATPGSGYVLLHHVMGEIEGVKGAWGYPEGGMGAVSEAIASSAREAGNLPTYKALPTFNKYCCLKTTLQHLYTLNCLPSE
jgi:hypothetical protein